MKKILLLIYFTITLFANDIDTAKELFDKEQKYEEAIEIFEKFSDDGESLYYLGKAYLDGMGVEKDEDKAFELAKKSADLNSSAGLNLLGILYQYGNGVKKDELKALDYYKQAVNFGNTKAMRNLGIAYSKGTIIRQDLEEAKIWFLKSIESGNTISYLDIGDMYFDKNDKAEALVWYLRYEKQNNYKTNKFFKERVSYLCQKLDDDENAIRLYLELAKNGHYEYTYSLYEFLQKYPNHPMKKEMLFSLEAASSSQFISLNTLRLTQQSLFNYYYYDNHEVKKAIRLAKKLYYKDNNIQAGCNLSSIYGNFLTNYYDIEKSYDIAHKIINENPPSNEISSCYLNMSIFYRSGYYVSKDINKALDLNKRIFYKIYKSKDNLTSKWIAKLYLEELEDYENARKWYQITYNLTKDKKYLNIVDEYKKSKPNYKETKLENIKQKIYPMIDNFSNKNQTSSVLESKKYYFIALVNGPIYIYDKNSLSKVQVLNSWKGVGIAGATAQMAYDEQKELLYCSGLNSTTDFSKNDIVKVFDIKTGKIVKTLDNKNTGKSVYLNLSEDGKYLVSINQGQKINIIDVKTKQIQHYNYANTAPFSKVNILKQTDDYIVNALAKDGMLYTFSINKARQIKKEKYNNQTSFKTFNGMHAEKILNTRDFAIKSFMLDDSDIFFQNKVDDSFYKFNFNKLQLSQTSNHIQQVNNKSSKINIKYNNYNASLEVYKDKKLLSNIEFYNIKALTHKIIDNKYIVVTTSDISVMYIFNLEGRGIAKLEGFNSIQENIYYKDNHLYTYGDDNIIHIWNIDNLDNYNKLPQSYDEEILYGFDNIFGGNVLEIFKDSDEDIEKVLSLQVKSNNLPYTPSPKQLRNFMKMFFVKKQTIKPLVSLYIKNEKDWILYTPEGLFTYEGNGKDLLKYHQNQGLYKEAKIIENDQLFDKFYRPDLIKKILAGEKVDIPMDVKSVILNILPPELKILMNKMINNKDIELTYQICDAGNGISNPKLVINGQAINPPTSRGFSIEKIKDKKCTTYRSTHTLYPGKSTIEIKAYDKDKYIANISEKLEVEADYKIVEKSNISYGNTQTEENNLTDTFIVDKPNLYLLSLAVSDYKDDNYNLKYPVKDVDAIKNEFLNKSNKTFHNIYTHELLDKKVNQENIDKIFNTIAQKIKINDTFILYLAGHGSTQEGKYQFIPYEVTQNISIDNLKENLSKIAAQTNKSLVMLDTCYSGAIIDNINDEATKNRLAYDSTINYIVASSSNQVALEGYKNHGIFTYSVLDALKKSDKLKVRGLADHVSEVVPKITQEKFLFQQIPQAKLNKNFTLTGGDK